MAGQERNITLRFLAEPADVNFGGKVDGGAVICCGDPRSQSVTKSSL